MALSVEFSIDLVAEPPIRPESYNVRADHEREDVRRDLWRDFLGSETEGIEARHKWLRFLLRPMTAGDY